MRSHRLAALAFALVLASCGGGGGGGGTVSPATGNTSNAGSGNGGGKTTSTPQSVHINMHIPGTASTSTSASRKSPQFVAAATDGVLVQVYASSDTTHSTVIGQSATDVSPGSTACGGASGARTCTINIPAPAGTDDFVFTTYNAPPNGATTFPGTATILASGAVDGQTIQAATANVVNVTLSGALANVQVTPYSYSLAAGLGATSYTLEVAGLDSGNDIILGPYVDQNGNPATITVTAAETGGSGLTTIALNAGSPSSTVSLASSSDTVKVNYNGGGSAGYGVTYTVTSPNSGFTAVHPYFSPLYVSSTSPSFTPGNPATLNLTASNQVATITLSEQNGQNVTMYANCGNVVTIGQPTGTGSTRTFTVTGATGGQCSFGLSFDNATYNFTVNAASNTSSTVAVPGTTLAYAAQGTSGIGIFNPAGTQVGNIATATSADVVAMDDAGNVYSATGTTGNTVPAIITEYTPGGSTYPPSYTQSPRTFTPSQPLDVAYIQASGSGEFLVSEFSTSGPGVETFDIWDPGKSGAPSRTITRTNPSSSPIFFGGIDHAGNVYIAYDVTCGSTTCVKYDVINASTGAVERTISESIVPQANQGGFVPNYFAAGPDGTLYVTEWNFIAPDPYNGVYIYPPSGPEQYVSTDVANPNGIDLDAAGNMYVVLNNSNYDSGTLSADTSHLLEVRSPSGDTQLKGVQLPPDPYPVTVAADGTAWVSVFPQPALGEAGGLYIVGPNSYTPTEVSTTTVNDVMLWNGNVSTLSHARTTASLGSAGSAHGSAVSLMMHRR